MWSGAGKGRTSSLITGPGLRGVGARGSAGAGVCVGGCGVRGGRL